MEYNTISARIKQTTEIVCQAIRWYMPCNFGSGPGFSGGRNLWSLGVFRTRARSRAQHIRKEGRSMNRVAGRFSRSRFPKQPESIIPTWSRLPKWL
eukprot:13980672-Heterocapsa_arctica.AAC.1